MAKEGKKRLVKLHQNAQRLLLPLHVVNPFVEKLRFPDHQTRTRRDHPKYLALIEVITLLHQYQRPIREVEHGGQRLRYVEVTAEDIAMANRLAHEVLGRSLDELPPQTRRLLELLDQFVAAGCEREKVQRGELRFSRREVREWSQWGDTQLRVHLERLVGLEYVAVHRGKQGQGFVYELRYGGEGKDGAPFLSGLLEPEVLGYTSTTETSRGVGSTSRVYEPTSRGSEGYFAGGMRGGSGPVSGGVRGGQREGIEHQNGSGSKSASGFHENAHPGSTNGKSSVVVELTPRPPRKAN
jgi:hypothetical protein